jgi:hypothetical protein
MRAESPCSSSQHRVLPYVAFNKDAFPNRRRIADRTESFSLPKRAQVFSREFSSAISGFRSLCGHQQRSSLSHRAQLDLPFGTFHSGRALLNQENSGIHPQHLRGQQPWTDVVPGT